MPDTIDLEIGGMTCASSTVSSSTTSVSGGGGGGGGGDDNGDGQPLPLPEVVQYSTHFGGFTVDFEGTSATATLMSTDSRAPKIFM